MNASNFKNNTDLVQKSIYIHLYFVKDKNTNKSSK